MKEHDFQKQAVAYIRALGWITICSDMMIALKFIGMNQSNRVRFISYAKGQGYSKGQPDLIIYKGGKTIYIEFKTEKGKQTVEQKQMENEIKDYFVVRNFNDLQDILK